MEKIIKISVYVCPDGTRFDSETEAKKYLELCDAIAEVSKVLLPRTSKCKNGLEYITQSKHAVNTFRDIVCDLAAKYYPEYAKGFKECGCGMRDLSYARVVVNASNISKNRALYEAITRLECISLETYREYSDSYYAVHEEEFMIDLQASTL